MTTQGTTSGAVRVRRRARALDVPVGTIEVLRAGYGDTESETETVQVPKFEGPVGYMRVEGSVTRNAGNFNSIRVAVMMEMPCYAAQSEVDRCYMWCSDTVANKIEEELRVACGEPRDGVQPGIANGDPDPGM